MKLGAQFYTIREWCKTLEGLDESMKKVADMGFGYIQLSGVCAYDANWMAERLKAYGLEAIITHYAYDKIINQVDETVAFHDAMNCPYIGIGSNPRGFTPEALEKMATELKPVLPTIMASGHKFMYHNHNMELARFDDGKTFMDLLCETFTPDECGVTLDTYWIQAGGGDPAWYIRNLQGRVDCIHFKDMVFSLADNKIRIAPIGEGNMNYPAILQACEDTGVKYGFVELDDCYGADPFECLKRSYQYLKAQGLA